MGRSQQAGWHVRRYRRGDRSAVRSICAATAWLGEPAPERIADEWIWAEFWTRYFTDREPQTSWTVARRTDGAVGGYLTGTADVGRFDRYVPFLLPGIVLRVVRKRLIRRRPSRRALLGFLRLFADDEMALPPGVARHYPATFHMNLLPEARRHGLGSRLLDRFLDRMRAMGTLGVHTQPLSVNQPIQRFLERRGFRLLASRPCHAFAHADPRPMDVQTWVLPL
ncbi:MAG TPA: GNAT family N-acetyltransferase [Phycisphaerae bacterium]|nr:GNAT family N-acetyltransferase [Phycisphaerae bacterium]